MLYNDGPRATHCTYFVRSDAYYDAGNIAAPQSFHLLAHFIIGNVACLQCVAKNVKQLLVFEGMVFMNVHNETSLAQLIHVEDGCVARRDRSGLRCVVAAHKPCNSIRAHKTIVVRLSSILAVSRQLCVTQSACE